jgi:hypothetical protein
VLNLIGQDGETLGMDGRQHLGSLAAMTGIEGPGTVLCHQGSLAVPAGLKPVTVDEAGAAEFGWKLLAAEVADPEADWPAHEPINLGRFLSQIV